jgi:hypothetical protein
MNDFHNERRDVPAALKAMKPAEFAQLGVGGMAYVKPVMEKGGMVYAIFAADGTQIGAAPALDLAMAAIVQHEMAPARVH